MIKELTTQEIVPCHGGNAVERICGKEDSAFIATMAALGTFVIFHSCAGFTKTTLGTIITALAVPIVLIATYHNVVGTTYVVDPDLVTC